MTEVPSVSGGIGVGVAEALATVGNEAELQTANEKTKNIVFRN